MLDVVARTRLCSGAQLERLFWNEGSPASRSRLARRALKRLTDWRILDRQSRVIGGQRAGSRGYVYSLGPAGVRLLARETGVRVRRPITPGERYVRHVLACTELVVQLGEADRTGTLEVIEVQSEPHCWRGFISGFGRRVILKPDLFVRVGVGALEDRWFIEIDLATEASGTLSAKARRYLAHFRSGSEQRTAGTYPRVLWVVPDSRRQTQLEAVLQGLPEGAHRLFAVCLSAETIQLLAAEARP
ncbi:MAG TPA: replication-relaxation family protein [Solirubrobacteraceae bacterium]|nr:replication-relaxation family protein [Solirubrobacteraceae bacterium]